MEHLGMVIYPDFSKNDSLTISWIYPTQGAEILLVLTGILGGGWTQARTQQLVKVPKQSATIFIPSWPMSLGGVFLPKIFFWGGKMINPSLSLHLLIRTYFLPGAGGKGVGRPVGPLDSQWPPRRSGAALSWNLATTERCLVHKIQLVCQRSSDQKPDYLLYIRGYTTLLYRD